MTLSHTPEKNSIIFNTISRAADLVLDAIDETRDGTCKILSAANEQCKDALITSFEFLGKPIIHRIM